MVKVLQMGMTNNLGGIEKFLINYFRNIDKTKIKMDFINIYSTDLCFSHEINKSSKIFNVVSYYKHPIKYVKEVKRIINENDYKIIHCNMNSAAMLWPLIAAKLSNATVVIAHAHNSSSDKGILKTILHNINKHFIPFLTNTYFACSEKAATWFFSKKIIHSKSFFIINNAINIEKYKFNQNVRDKVRKNLKIQNDTLVIGHVGRFCKQKNHDFLVDIFNEVHKENNNSVLLLIGTGPLEETIKSKVRDLKIENSVIFLEQRNDVNELYQAMDIFLFPSLYEGLSVALVEAQVSGMVCICSDNVTQESKISNNIFFYSLDKKAKEWEQKIESVKKNKRIVSLELLNYDRFDIQNEVKRLEKIYEERII